MCLESAAFEVARRLVDGYTDWHSGADTADLGVVIAGALVHKAGCMADLRMLGFDLAWDFAHNLDSYTRWFLDWTTN